MVSHVPGGRSLRDVNVKPKWQPELKYTVYLQTKGEKKYSIIEVHVCQQNTIKRGIAVIATLVATQVDILFPINVNIVPKPLPIASQVDFRASGIGSLARGCISRGGSDLGNTRIDWLTLRGLFHQKMYITKFLAVYASVTISRWLTGRCPMICAIHCNTNHDVWSRIKDLQSWTWSAW